MNFKALIAAGALLATQSFAIIGIGGHYAPSFGNKMSAAAPTVVSPDNALTEVLFDHDAFKGTMQGFGFKLWVDILPIIDVEATFNIQFASYNANLYVENPTDASAYQKVPLEIELGGTPFGKATPKFVAMNGDLSITYPITFLPIVRPYIGGGVTYFLNSFVLNDKFVKKLMSNEDVANLLTGNTDALIATATDVANGESAEQIAEEKAKKLQQTVQDAAMDEGLNTSIGGHILVGVRAKLPIIPIAAYANFKYYFGADYPSEVDPGNMAVELGVGLAI